MSDYNSSLPIRTENNGDVVAKIADATVPSQQLAVGADGSINVTDNGGSLTVDAVNLDIRDLVFATDKVDVSGSTGIELGATTLAALESITVQNGAGAAAVNIQDGGNSITIDGSVSVSNLPATVDTNYGTVGASTLRSAAQIGNATGAANFNNGATGAQTLRVAANLAVAGTDVANGNPVPVSDAGGSLTVDAINLDIRDLTHVSDSVKIGDGTDFLAINADGSINVVPQEDSGTEIVNYNTAAAVAGGASSNHDYTSAAAAKLYQVFAAASGKLKIEVQVETAAASGTFNTIAVGFNSTANPNINLTLAKYRVVPNGARVRVIRTNKDGQAQDVYSTIVAIEG